MSEANNLTELSERIGYSFRDSQLLRHALTHSSYTSEHQQEYCENNERLEFLGDSVLDAIISEELYHRVGHADEGSLTKNRALIVCERSLFQHAVSLDIGNCLFLGKGEEKNGGRSRTSILADAVEAIIGAVYLDGGFEEAKNLVSRLFTDTVEAALAGKLYSDYKTELQERLQANGEVAIHYMTDREEGPDHDKTFYVTLRVGEEQIGRGVGHSKKEAEQMAAKNALETMRW